MPRIRHWTCNSCTRLHVNLLILKHIFDHDLGRQFPKILGLMRDLVQQEGGLEMLQTVVVYISAASNAVTEAELYQGVISSRWCISRSICRVPRSPASG